jgi:hypothetical protein
VSVESPFRLYRNTCIKGRAARGLFCCAVLKNLDSIETRSLSEANQKSEKGTPEFWDAFFALALGDQAAGVSSVSL